MAVWIDAGDIRRLNSYSWLPFGRDIGGSIVYAFDVASNGAGVAQLLAWPLRRTVAALFTIQQRGIWRCAC